MFTLAILSVLSSPLQRPDSSVLVTRLGSDTLVVERVVRTPRRIEAEVLMRVPRTQRTVYVADFSPAGDLVRLEAQTFDPRGAADPVGDNSTPEGRAENRRAVIILKVR